MRNLMLACAAFAVISAIVSVNLWRELSAERGQTAQLRAQLAAAQVPQSGSRPDDVRTAATVGLSTVPVTQPATAAADADALPLRFIDAVRMT